MLSITLLPLLLSALTLATPLHPRQEDIPYQLNCNDSAQMSIWCGNNGVPACTGPESPDPNTIPVSCAYCTCSQFAASDDMGSGFIPPSAALPPNAKAPDGEDCKVWNERLASNGAMRAEGYQFVKPCN